jgi:hypothetical protein
MTPEQIAKTIGDIEFNNGILSEVYQGQDYQGQDPPTEPPTTPEATEMRARPESELISTFKQWLETTPAAKSEWEAFLISDPNATEILPKDIWNFFIEWLHKIPDWLYEFCEHDFEYQGTQEDEDGRYDEFRCTKCGLETSERS